MALLTPEEIIRRVVTLYTDNYNDALTTVAAKWAATEDIPLTDFVSRVISASPEFLPNQWDSPYLVVAAGPLAPVAEETYQQFHNRYELQIRCYYFFRHGEAETLAKLIMRHEEATLDFLNQHPSLDFGDGNQIRPDSLVFDPSANTLVDSSNALVKGLQVSFDFRFLQYGF